MIHQNDSSDIVQQLLQQHGSSKVADLEALENLEISPKNPMSDTTNSSHVAVMQQLQQIRRMPLSPADGEKIHEPTTSPELRNNKDTSTISSAVVTSVSQYELTQSHERVRNISILRISLLFSFVLHLLCRNRLTCPAFPMNTWFQSIR